MKMSDENVIYCLENLAGYEPDDIDCDDVEIAVNDDQFTTMSIVRAAELGAELARRLTEENAKLRYHLESMVGESIYLAKFKNEALKRSICSADLDEPEWHDYQAIAEAANLLNQLKEQNNDK